MHFITPPPHPDLWEYFFPKNTDAAMPGGGGGEVKKMSLYPRKVHFTGVSSIFLIP